MNDNRRSTDHYFSQQAKSGEKWQILEPGFFGKSSFASQKATFLSSCLFCLQLYLLPGRLIVVGWLRTFCSRCGQFRKEIDNWALTDFRDNMLLYVANYYFLIVLLSADPWDRYPGSLSWYMMHVWWQRWFTNSRPSSPFLDQPEQFLNTPLIGAEHDGIGYAPLLSQSFFFSVFKKPLYASYSVRREVTHVLVVQFTGNVQLFLQGSYLAFGCHGDSSKDLYRELIRPFLFSILKFLATVVA